MSTILHVEDESSIRLLYKEVFEELGYQVIQASTGEEALSLLRTNRPDIIILDLKMPGMGGRGFIKKFQKMKMKIPVVVSTAYPYFSGDPILPDVDAFVLNLAIWKNSSTRFKNCSKNRRSRKASLLYYIVCPGSVPVCFNASKTRMPTEVDKFRLRTFPRSKGMHAILMEKRSNNPRGRPEVSDPKTM